MTPSVAFLRSDGDQVERRLAEIGDKSRRELAEAEMDHTVEVVQIGGRFLDRARLADMHDDIDGIVYFGHGTADSLGDPALIDSANLDVLRDRVAIALCCHSAASLGPAACASGARAYLGFRDLMCVVVGQAPWPGPFEQALTGFLLPGGTIGECSKQLFDGLTRQRDRYMPGGPKSAHPDAGVIWLSAQANLLALHLIGDHNATLAR